ncbi:MAG TPA: hypothetical protein PKV73_14130, partial [Agriterribacter sp.]|nr:hypothetical protein [Agriterribacter sp.]
SLSCRPKEASVFIPPGKVYMRNLKCTQISGTGKFLNYNTSVVPAPYRTTDFEKQILYMERTAAEKQLLPLY